MACTARLAAVTTVHVNVVSGQLGVPRLHPKHTQKYVRKVVIP
jgi:hypothetical protein